MDVTVQASRGPLTGWRLNITKLQWRGNVSTSRHSVESVQTTYSPNILHQFLIIIVTCFTFTGSLSKQRRYCGHRRQSVCLCVTACPNITSVSAACRNCQCITLVSTVKVIPSPILPQFLLLACYVPNVAKRSVWEQCNIKDRRPTDPPTDRPTSHFGKFRTAISRQRVIQSTSCLVLG